MLWKHVDAETGAQVRRMRRMVVSAHITVANYEYLVYWRFYQDGNIECEVRATGLMVTTPMQSDGDSSPYGTKVDTANLRAVPPALHRSPNSTWTSTAKRTRWSRWTRSPSRSARTTRTGWRVSTQTTTIESESQSARDFKWETQRTWKVINPNKVNRHGSNTAYKLVPGAAIPSLLDSSSPGLPASSGHWPYRLGDRVRRCRTVAGR